jgi:hypothetical protein
MKWTMLARLPFQLALSRVMDTIAYLEHSLVPFVFLFILGCYFSFCMICIFILYTFVFLARWSRYCIYVSSESMVDLLYPRILGVETSEHALEPIVLAKFLLYYVFFLITY